MINIYCTGILLLLTNNHTEQRLEVDFIDLTLATSLKKLSKHLCNYIAGMQQPSILAANFARALYKFILLMSYFAIIIKKRVKDLKSKLVIQTSSMKTGLIFTFGFTEGALKMVQNHKKTNHIFIILISICNRDLNCDIINT